MGVTKEIEVNATIAKTIPILTEPLVRMGIYKNQREALKGLMLQLVQQKINEAQQEIIHFERKYGMSFEEWTASLIGKASIEEEDDWMEWESARDILESWQRIKAEIERSNV
jgi:hypothetical protein